VGSRSNINLAYIAGFLDGDGSLMLQLKKRTDNPFKKRFMATICFYQDSRHEMELMWIRSILGIGYISHRNDGMAELRINGFKPIRNILTDLIPYIRFKKHQAKALHKAVCMLEDRKLSNLNMVELEQIISCILIIQKHNYSTSYKKTEFELKNMLGLTP
jgi:hypothetical protein